MERSVYSGFHRRLKLPFGQGGAAQAGRFGASFVLAAGLLLGSIAGGGAALADDTPAPTASSTGSADSAPTSSAAADPGSVALTVAPDDAGTLAAGQDLGITVALANTTAHSVPAGAMHVWLDRTPLSTRSTLSAWLDPATAVSQAKDSVAVDVATPAAAAGQTVSLRAVIPAAQLRLSAWGAYGIEASLAAGQSVVGSRSVVVWSVGAPAVEASLGVIMPLTVQPSSSGLINAADLASATSETGVLTKKLDSSLGRPITLAIDPMVIVSIRVLGTAAPQSALDWLARLAAAPNATFPLTYADSDPAVQRAAGAPNVLSPISLSYALSSANFQSLPSPDPFALPGQAVPPAAGTGAAAGAATAAGTPASPVPTPSPTPSAGQLPSQSDLTSWHYTRTDIAWPQSGTASTADLDFFAASGMPTSILSSDNLTQPDSSVVPNAASNVGDKRVIVLDSSVSTALQSAADAANEVPRDAALAAVSATLAVITATAPAGTTPTVVASLGRAEPASTFGVSRALDTVEALPWAVERPLAEVLSTPGKGVSISDSPEPADWVANVATMIQTERDVSGFSVVAPKPELITGRQRVNLLAVLAQSWSTDVDGRTAAAADYAKASTTLLSSVQIVDGSNINLVAADANVPVLISNALNQSVTVSLHVTPSNGRLVVEPNTIEVTVAANSQKTAQVPVKASVASGEVSLRLELYNSGGVLVSSAAPKEINVSADWEGIGTLIVAIVAGAFVVFGVVRVVLRRRKARTAAQQSTPEPSGPEPSTPDAPSHD
ncbi:DUF6049 family protein [Subtercola vilae]|uniref:Uncharacterized protein n=1 Tax=Subtercola vilae TaxID=2056433 RepID=A0A4T2CFA9_9MICO|nr:DUF6049 family protein [Subtercola vilae]TIH40878.1 hypothetical protein D4765_00250 [Subtercola vilae]